MLTPAHGKLLAFAQPFPCGSCVICPRPSQLPVVTHPAASSSMSPNPNCQSASSLLVGLSVSPLRPSLSLRSHSSAELLPDPHPHLSFTDLFPPQCFSLPAAKSPLPVLLLLHSCVWQTHHLGCYAYFFFFIVSFTIKCFLQEKRQNIGSW